MAIADINKPVWAAFALFLLGAAPTAGGAENANADIAVGDALEKCAAIGQDVARLACYDELASSNDTGGSEADEQEPVEIESVAAPSVPTEPPAAVAITDEVGKERIERVDDDKRQKYAATVVRCRESPSSGQYYFYLKNEQVWKQKNYRRLRYRDCNFEVEITKGTFGYQMYIPSKDSSVRVARIR